MQYRKCCEFDHPDSIHPPRFTSSLKKYEKTRAVNKVNHPNTRIYIKTPKIEETRIQMETPKIEEITLIQEFTWKTSKIGEKTQPS